VVSSQASQQTLNVYTWRIVMILSSQNVPTLKTWVVPRSTQRTANAGFFAGQECQRRRCEMGFSSWECNGCGHPLLSEWVTTDVNAWMKQSVIVPTPQRQWRWLGIGVFKGSYNGYASIETRQFTISEAWRVGTRSRWSDWEEGVLEISIVGWSIQHEWGREELEPCVWHEACWNKAGQPTEHQPSNPATDQGYFFNHATGHQMEEPK